MRGIPPGQAATLALLVAAGTCLPATGLAAKDAVLEVVLDGEKVGTRFLLLQEGDVLFPHDEFLEIGFARAPGGIELRGRSYVSLRSLAPDVTFELDEGRATLNVTADPRLLRTNVVDFRRPPPGDVAFVAGRSAVLNYGISHGWNEASGDAVTNLSWEAAVRPTEDVLVMSGVTHLPAPSIGEPVRLLTSLVRDWPEEQRRLTLGDGSVASGVPGGRGLVLGGVTFSKNLALSPLTLRTSGLDLVGVLDAPADVEVYVDDRLVQRVKLSPGEFVLQNLTLQRGAGRAKLLVRDSFGRETTTEVPFYLSSALLRPGVHEWSYGLGPAREALGTESFRYGGITAAGSHRAGITRNLTLGGHAEVDRHVLCLGSSVNAVLGRAGELEASAAASWSGAGAGLAGVARYGYGGRGFGALASVTSATAAYTTAGVLAASTLPRLEVALGLGAGTRRLGALSVGLSHVLARVGPDRTRASLTYQRVLAGNLALTVTAARTWAHEPATELQLGLIAHAGRGWSGGLQHRSGGRGGQETLQLQRTPASSAGTGVQLAGERRDGPAGAVLSGSGSIRHAGAHGMVSARVARSGLGNRYDLGLAGAVALVGGSAFLTRPIADGFALVEVQDLDGIGVSSNGREQGKASPGSGVIVTDLVSHHPHRISLDAQRIPIGVEMTTSKRVATPYRGGGVVRFEARKHQGLRGRAHFVAGETREPAALAGLEIDVAGKPLEAIVGREGRFFAEDVPPGVHRARLFAGARECSFDLDVPASDALVVDVGEVGCAPR